MNLKPPSIPYMSNVSGDFIKESEATDPQYYVNHLRYAVRFSENIKNLLAVQDPIFIEIGPGKTLTSLTKLNSQNTDNILINTVKHKRQEISDYEILLTAVGKLWLAGVNIDWQNYSSGKSSKAHLPTYAFNKKRYWIKSKPVKNSNDRSNQSLSNLNNWIYRTSWERLSLEYLPSQSSYNENIIVFEDQNCRVSDTLKNRVNGNLVKVHQGKSFKRIDRTAYHINPNNPDDYLEIFKSIVKDGIDVNHIIHSWSVTGDIHDTKTIAFDDYQILGYISLIYIAKSLSEIDSSEKIGMQVISSNIFDILGDEEIIAEKTTLLGAVRVIRQEKPNLDISILEIDDFDKNPQLISNWLLYRFEKPSDNFSTAIRGKYYWQQTFKKIDHSGNSLLKSNGTYLITGGLGRIALVLADHLAKNYQANIILVDKFNIPPKNDWESYLSEDQNSADMTKRIEKLIKIDKIAESLTVINNDISSLEDLKTCIGNVLSEFKKIDGIIHAAGTVGGGMVKLINDFNLNDYEDQIKPKINGTINISRTIKELQLDFVFVQSSLASLLGGIGFSNYSAVNNFIDSFSLLKNRETKNGTKWISVNWDGWNFDENTGAEGINPDQGIELFEKALIENSRGNIIISTGDLNESVQKWIDGTHKNTDVDDEEKDSKSENHERPDLDNEYVQPETDIEKQICQEWENLLGIEGIGVNDNFFDLGGDSLIGTQLVSRLRKIYNTDIPLVSVFENATVRGIAAILQSNKVNDPDTELMADIFEKVDQMSEEEIAKILSKKNNQN
jgi:NAD(P)-dependent dehydrogenase (short-subunit alcohol dehydrogenase family)/acyl carrier protein